MAKKTIVVKVAPVIEEPIVEKPEDRCPESCGHYHAGHRIETCPFRGHWFCPMNRSE